MLNLKPMNHQTGAPEATGMEEAISEKLKVFTHRGAGRGNISGLQCLRDEADDKGSKSSKFRIETSAGLWLKMKGLRGLASPRTRSSSGI